uniref:Uncharacterized protein n=1 Tax=Steinernema glaseri TaxID=37863 RepID=A0A1I7ZRM6_9BILA
MKTTLISYPSTKPKRSSPYPTKLISAGLSWAKTRRQRKHERFLFWRADQVYTSKESQIGGGQERLKIKF